MSISKDFIELGEASCPIQDLHDWLITTPPLILPTLENGPSPQTKKTHLSESFESCLYV